MESKFNMHVRIVGEPFLSKAKAYRDEMNRVTEIIREFAKVRGASGIPGSLHGLNFKNGKPPEGWTKPKGRHSFSEPKKNHPDVAALAALPRLPKSRDVFGETLIFDIAYKGPEHSGFSSIGWFFEGPNIGWAGDMFIATIPNAKAAAADHLAEHPQDTITNGADKWSLPDGLVEISKAEMDMIYATHQVAQEKKTKAEAA